MGVGVDSRSPSEKITPRQQMAMMQINNRLMPPIKQFLVSSKGFCVAAFDCVDEDAIEGVKDRPVPGAEIVGRTPRLPMLTVKPLPPIDEEIPDLLRLIRKPFPSGMILRKRNGIYFTQWAIFLRGGQVATMSRTVAE